VHQQHNLRIPTNQPTNQLSNFADVLRDQSNPDKYFFYEVYESAAAVDFHKTQPHYAAWADFKESGGAISSVSHKADGEFMS